MKKILSLLLALVLVFGMMPMTSFAANQTGGKITFTTDFEEGMEAGDTFSVTATLSDNPGIASFTNSLSWNEDVVKFTGFSTNSRGKLDTEVFMYDTTVFNNQTGIITAALDYNNTDNGKIYTANFEILAGGEMGIGLATTEHGSKFTFADVNGSDIDPELDFSALEGLTAGGAAAAPDMPEGAPFTAITTDAGDIVAIEQQEDVYDVPYYIVTIPADAATAYVTVPDQLVMKDFTTQEMQATAYAFDLENGWDQLYISYDYEDSADGPVVEIPMNMVASDLNGEVELCFVEDEDRYLTHAFGIEDTNYACTGILSFRYAEDTGSGEVPAPATYTITVDNDNITGGKVFVDKESAAEGEEFHVTYEADPGYEISVFMFGNQPVPPSTDTFKMGKLDVTITARFVKIPYTITVNEAEHGTVTADMETATVGDTVTLTVEPDEGYELGLISVLCEGSQVVINDDNTFEMPVGDVTVTANFTKLPAEGSGYTFATSADVTAEGGGTAVVYVKVTGHNDETVTKYNAYDVTLTFDSEKLTFTSYDGAVKSDGGTVTAEGNTIRIVGCGKDKTFSEDLAALTFTTKAEGAAQVKVSSVQISDKKEAVEADAPAAEADHGDSTTEDTTPDTSVITVPYSVTKPDFVTGNDKVLDGKDYTFSYTDTTNYTYSNLKVTVGGQAVTPEENEGEYTIANITGAVEITATQTANSYDVTKTENVNGPDKATYGTDYVFTVKATENMIVESVNITLDAAEGETEVSVPYTHNAETGEYTIAGKDIAGAFSITVKEVEDIKKTTVNFEGITSDEIEGGQLSHPADVDKAFTFKLIKSENHTYVVKVGDTELEEKDGSYTIPKELVVEAGVTVTITKTEIVTLAVEVNQYITLNGKSMFLITAVWGDKVLAYGEDTMFYSEKYSVEGSEGAYCWLVLTDDTADAVAEAAKEAIKEAENSTAVTIAYDYDVNGTTKADVNDAQLVYDMYNASYEEFTENLPMKKFLEADLECDKHLDTRDVTAIINHLVK